MAKRKQAEPVKRIPKVRIGRPKGRPYQLRYLCPIEGREVRISTGTRDEQETQRQKAVLEAKLLLGIDAKPKKVVRGPNMPWEDFRQQYSELNLEVAGSNPVPATENSM